jgi:hypothetical protein
MAQVKQTVAGNVAEEGIVTPVGDVTEDKEPRTRRCDDGGNGG